MVFGEKEKRQNTDQIGYRVVSREEGRGRSEWKKGVAEGCGINEGVK